MTTAETTLLIRLSRELALISHQQHALQRRRYAIEAALTSLRTGEAEEVVEARLDAEMNTPRENNERRTVTANN